ncbi:zinc ribbon domain-containing protein [Chloroflexota bacterium]
MEQKVQCPKCDFQNNASFKFCAYCGEKLAVASCPNCGIAINSTFRFCPNCGGALYEEAKQETEQKESSDKTENPVELLEDIRVIGAIKNELPFNQQQWCDVLGLHIWYRGLDRYTHGVDGVWVKAGGKYSTKIEGWTDPKKSWEVKKYKHGDWEASVKPTLVIAKWLRDHDGLKVEDRDAFIKSIDIYKRSGKLNLPQ